MRTLFLIIYTELITIALSLPLWSQSVATVLPTTTQIESGEVSGVVLDEGEGLVVYRGIPFAAPPVGELRWRPPQPAKSWEGVRACHIFGPPCTQKRNGIINKEGKEDCLYLNVWTAHLEEDDKRPVMVWIHGGGLNSGAGHLGNYDGSEFARQGVILVSINYRLGPLGFLAHPALSAESEQKVSGNYGFLDQIAALQWVKENIASFGGDPDNVTIFGESAGGTSVGILCSSPLAKGLFHRAILQSPWMFGYVTNLAEPNIINLKGSDNNFPSNEQLGVDWANQLVDAKGAEAIEELRALNAEELVAIGGYHKTRATIDGWLLPDRPEQIFAKGEQADVPTIVGTTKDEGNLFAKWITAKDRNQFKERLAKYYGDQSDRVAELFPGETQEELRHAGSRFVTESWFLHPSRRLLRGMQNVSAPAYQYEFTKANRWNAAWGAMHAGEIPYVFNTLDSEKTKEDHLQLGRKMMKYWIQFATTGNPNVDGLPHWPEYTIEEAGYLELGDSIEQGANLRDEICDELDRVTESIYGG